jgi:hypothetical protein
VRCPDRCVPVAYVGVRNRLEEALLEDNAAVEPLGQALEDGPRHGVAVVDLPEGRGRATVLVHVIVMERPDAIARHLQNLTPDDIEREAEDEIEVVTSDLVEIPRKKVFRELAFAHDLAR